MEKDIIIFTGPQRFCSEVQKQGFQTAVLQAPGEDLSARADVDFAIPYDPADTEGLARTVNELPYRGRVAAVFNRRELRVREAAVINQALGFTGCTVEQAEILTDKYRLHVELQKTAPELVSDFELLTPDRKLGISPPVVLKPRNMFKSQLISLCATADEASREVARLAREGGSIARRHGVDLKHGMLAEAYLKGTECALDSFVDEQGIVKHGLMTELLSARALGFDDFHVFSRVSPGFLTPEQQDQVNRAAEKAIHALGLRNSATHMDFVITDTGPKILEIGARIGGYRTEMSVLSYGYSLDQALLDTLLGKKADLTPRFVRQTAVLEFFPEAQGRLKTVHGMEQVGNLASFNRMKMRFREGDDVGLAAQGFRCVLFVVLNHEDGELVREDMERCRDLVEISTMK